MIKFSDVNWGQDDGTGDTGLRDYFVEIPEFNNILSGDIRYVIGRKGTGKSAIAEKIRLESEQKYNWFYCDLSLKDFPLALFRSMEDKSQKGKAKYVPAWKFLIYIKLTSLILSDNSCDSIDKNTLQNFMDINFKGLDVGFTDIIKTIASNKFKLTIPKTIVFGFETGKEQQTTIYYSNVNTSILKIIKNINSESMFFMLFDELDEDFSANDESIRLILLALFKAIESIYQELKRYEIKFRPLLLLRSDIFDGLRDNDLNKLDDFIFRLNWSKYAGSKYDLKSIVEARIKASLQDPNAIWEDIAFDYDESRSYYIKSLWDFMINRTYERPRDIIKFLKICKKKHINGKLDEKCVRDAEFDYSHGLFDELDNEIYAHSSIWNKAAMLISNIGVNCFKIEELEKQFNDDIDVSKYLKNNNMVAIQLIELLFNFGILGTIEPITKRWIFKYKDQTLPFNKNAKLIVHYGLLKKFRVRVRPI